MSLAIATLAAAAAPPPSTGIVGLLVPLVLMGGVFYFLLIRPQQKRMRAQKEMISELEVGEEVLTIGGIYGTIREVDEDDLILEVAPGQTLRIVKSAISRRLSEETAEHDDDDEDQSDADDSDEDAGDEDVDAES